MVNYEQLHATALAMVKNGILAADESHGTLEKPKTIEKRLIAAHIPPTEENVNAWRVLVRDTPNLRSYISAVILEESRVAQDAQIFAGYGIIPGVKVDKGTSGKVGQNEALTVGLDGLADRLQKYGALGAKFAKWRTVTPIGENLPTQGGIDANMDTLVAYAQACHQAGIVPMCEPEVLIDGNHTIQQSYDTTKQVLTTLFEKADKSGLS